MTGPTPTATTSSRASTTGEHVVSFYDPIGEYVGEYYNNVPLGNQAGATRVAVAPGQAVVNIDAALAAAPVVAPVGVDLSGTVRDELGNIGVGYEVLVYDTPADARTREVVARTYSNRSGAYHFTELDRIAGETQFKVLVDGGDGPREEGDFARRDTWSGNKVGYETASAVTAAPQVLDFTLPVAGGISGSVTSEAGGSGGERLRLLHRRRQQPRRQRGHRGRRHVRRTARCGRATTPCMFGAYRARPRVVEGRPRPRAPPRSRSSPARSSPASPAC